jgi:hypothetical protein
MESTMSILNKFKGIVAVCTDYVNEQGDLPKISHELTQRNSSGLRHPAQSDPKVEMLEFKVTEPNGFESHPKRFKAPREKDLLLDTEETLIRKFGNEVFN